MVLSGRIEKHSPALKVRMPLKGRFEKTLTITVGGENGHERQEFTVHKTPICFHSGFFQRACNGRWVEAESAHIELPEDNPTVFEVLVQWLYTQGIADAICDDGICDDDILTYEMLVQLYVLADKLEIPRLNNLSLDAFVKMYEISKNIPGKNIPGKNVPGKNVPGERIIQDVWRTTMAGSPLRQVCVDLWGWNSFPALYDAPEEAENLGDFFYRVAQILSKRTGDVPKEQAPFRTSMCQYHEPAIGASCSCCKKREEIA